MYLNLDLPKFGFMIGLADNTNNFIILAIYVEI